ncbi:MAG: thiamine pyrophosphate-binding protein [Actinomycetota bacterium]|nr:thiamine pyrophosphate-binding protein [Actinomycetota bacterium]MDD5668141.1 thiamine pyrophosphate-binding protein [Actinomycetota bacterium]
MAEVHGGRVVAEYLKNVEGIDTIFALSGGHIAPIFDGCLDTGVRVVDVRHEQAAVMMAHAWSIYTGKPGVCLVTAGPGFTNSLTGVVNAFLENVPVVVLCGMVALRDLDKGALQDMDQQSMVKPVVKWAGRCHQTERIPEYLEMAFRNAVSGRPGPVFLEINPEALYGMMEEEGVAYPAAAAERYAVLPEEDALAQAVELLNGAERPLLVGGSGIAHSRCAEEVKALVEKAGIPTILLDNGRGAIPDEHPLSLWDGGLMGVMAAASMADVVLAVGIRFNWVLNFGDILANAKVIRVDIDAGEINRNRKADVALVGDAGAVLGKLGEGVAEKDRSAWLESLRGSFAAITAGDRQAMETPADPIHPLRLVQSIREATGDDAIFIVDGGDTLYFGSVGLRAREISGVIGSGTLFGCLGTGVPFAIGAKVALPDKRVVLLTGDGSFGLNAMELETSCRHGAPIVVVICNDQAWGMVKHHQELCYEECRVCGTDLGVIHYEMIAEALGGRGEFVDKEADILPALKRALDYGGPACVNVITDPTVTSPATLMFVEGFKF